MQKRFLKFLIFLLVLKTPPLQAEDAIQTFLSPNGKVIFTNLVDNAPAPVTPVLPETTDVLAHEVPLSLRSLVDTIALNHGVDPGLVRAVMKTESNFNRWAVSPKGALGLMQLIPSTGRRYGVRDFFDPQQNVDGGVRHLKFLLEKFNGNLDLSLAAYNAGENLVERLGRVPPIPETTNYVRRIRALYKKRPMTGAGKSKPPVIAEAMTTVSEAPANESPRDDGQRIYRSVDQRGVVHFSNVEPPN